MSASIKSNNDGSVDLKAGTNTGVSISSTGAVSLPNTNSLSVPSLVVGTLVTAPDVSAASSVAQVAFFISTTAPTGWLKANGAAVSRTTYSALFNKIGTIFGAGNGSSTFNLPDFRGEFFRAWDDGRGIDAGRTFASWQADLVKSHSHTTTVQLGDAITSGETNTISAGGSLISKYNTFNSDAFGGSENRPRNFALLACIRY